MAFFDTLANKSKDVAEKAKKLAEVTGLNAQVVSKESEIKTAYGEIGKMIYENKAAWKDVDLSELIGKIEGIEAEIDKLKEEIRVTKGVKICTNCGEEIDITVAFCPKCGTPAPKVEEPAEESVDETQVIDVVAEEVAAEEVAEEPVAEEQPAPAEEVVE